MTPLLGRPAAAMGVTPDRLAAAANPDTALIVEDCEKPVACLFTRPSRDISGALYLGWLAVAQTHRRRGLALALVKAAEDEARSRNFAALTLDTGCELASLQALFLGMGFQQHSNDGTIIRFCKPIPDTGQTAALASSPP